RLGRVLVESVVRAQPEREVGHGEWAGRERRRAGGDLRVAAAVHAHVHAHAVAHVRARRGVLHADAHRLLVHAVPVGHARGLRVADLRRGRGRGALVVARVHRSGLHDAALDTVLREQAHAVEAGLRGAVRVVLAARDAPRVVASRAHREPGGHGRERATGDALLDRDRVALLHGGRRVRDPHLHRRARPAVAVLLTHGVCLRDLALPGLRVARRGLRVLHYADPRGRDGEVPEAHVLPGRRVVAEQAVEHL